MKRFLPLLLALVLVWGLSAPALAAEFSDVPAGHSFRDAISFCSEKGIVGGYSDGTYRPANTVTRSNFTVMLARAFYPQTLAEYDTPNYRANGQFYPSGIALMLNHALRNVSFENFITSNMNEGISRYDMALLMTNIMNNNGHSASDAEKTAAAANIADYQSIPSQYKDAVANVYALGLIGGYADGAFRGTATMNRGQAAVVIYRMSQRVPLSGPVETPDPTSAPVVTPDPAPVETPVVSGRTLANGKAITEENVTEILNQLKVKYPTPTGFAQGYAGLNSGRNPGNNCIKQTVLTYTDADGFKKLYQ